MLSRMASRVAASTTRSRHKRHAILSGVHMRFVVPVVLLLVAAIHALPTIGVMGASKLSRLYGFPVTDGSFELVLRHRAVLFGLLAAFLVYAAFKPELHRLGLVAGFVAVGSFLVLAALVSSYSDALATVVRIDWAALALLSIGLGAHVFGARR
jgi:hypothetical protein